MAKENWLTKIFKPKTKKGTFNTAVTMKGYEPAFSSFGSSTLYSDIILSSIKMKARYFGKLEPKHVRNVSGRNETITEGSVAKLLKNPNAYQTTYDFLTQAFFMRELQDNCFIYPDYYKTNEGTKVYTGLYVLLPSETPEIREEDGNLYISFKIDGYNSEIIFNLDEIAIWKKDIEDHTFLGGGRYNNSAKADLLQSLETYHQIKNSVAEAAKLSCAFDGIIKVNALSGDYERNKVVRNQFIEDLKNGRSGIGVLDAGSEYQPLSRQLKMVDAATMKEIKDNILIHEGVTIEMLMGKFTNEDRESLYETHIQPAAISLGQALTKVIFSQWQQSHGDQIELYAHKIDLMSTTEKISLITATISAGVFKIDEYRDMLGYPPLENGEGQARPRGFNNLDGATDPSQTTPTGDNTNQEME